MRHVGHLPRMNNEDFRDLCLENIIWTIKKNEMGGAGGKYRVEDRCIQGFGGKS